MKKAKCKSEILPVVETRKENMNILSMCLLSFYEEETQKTKKQMEVVSWGGVWDEGTRTLLNVPLNCIFWFSTM